MRPVSLGQSVGQTDSEKLRWVEQALRQIELASNENENADARAEDAYLVAGNNLSELTDMAVALATLGGAPLASPVFTGNVTVNTGNLNIAAATKLLSWGAASSDIGMGQKAGVVPDASVANTISYGIGFFRDNTVGGTALVLYDGGNTPVIVAQTGSSVFSITDPGTGGNKWFVRPSPNNGGLISRFAANRAVWSCLIGIGVSIAP